MWSIFIFTMYHLAAAAAAAAVVVAVFVVVVSNRFMTEGSRRI